MIVSDDIFNSYKIMWVFACFDLPVETKKERKAAAYFRKNLLKDGFRMFQYSLYIRHSMSKENAEVHINRVKEWLPESGHVVLFMVTDKQFENIEVFYGAKAAKPPSFAPQLAFF